jgi:hypothetical protein
MGPFDAYRPLGIVNTMEGKVDILCKALPKGGTITEFGEEENAHDIYFGDGLLRRGLGQ